MFKKLKTRYSDWSSNISSYMPKFHISDDTLQLYINFMVIVAIFGVIPLATQSWRVFRTKETKGISIYAFSFQILISTLWIGYALMTGNGIIIIASGLLVTAASILVFLTWKYSTKDDETPESE